MGELLDRGAQLSILNKLAADYPADSDIDATFGSQHDNQLKVNLSYLYEHGLIECILYSTKDDPYPLPEFAKITAAGLDFLADDGGLSAILGVVTVRFDDQTLKALLVARIEKEGGDSGVKAKMIAVVQSMPADALKAVSEKAIAYGLTAAPTGLKALGNFLGI